MPNGLFVWFLDLITRAIYMFAQFFPPQVVMPPKDDSNQNDDQQPTVDSLLLTNTQQSIISPPPPPPPPPPPSILPPLLQPNENHSEIPPPPPPPPIIPPPPSTPPSPLKSPKVAISMSPFQSANDYQRYSTSPASSPKPNPKPFPSLSSLPQLREHDDEDDEEGDGESDDSIDPNEDVLSVADLEDTMNWQEVQEKLLGSAAKNQLEGEDEVNANAFATSRASDGSALPFGWKEVFDAVSGNNYYFNEVTGQSQWLSPTQTPFSQGGTGSTTPVRKLTKRELKLQRESRILYVKCPKGHASRFCESGAEAYGLTGVSSVTVGCDACRLDRPEENLVGFFHCDACKYDICLPCARKAAEPRPPKEPFLGDESELGEAVTPPRPRSCIQSVWPLPAGWEEATDPSTDRAYYFNENTQVSQWERPKVKKEVKIRSFFKTIEMKVQSPILPPGWRAVVDEDTGRTYYWNDHTGESTWKLQDLM